MDSYTPVTGVSNSAALRETVKKASDITISSATASRVTQALQNTTDADMVLQYHLLPKFLEEARRRDPDGKYILETKPQSYAKNAFWRLFIVFGFVVHWWRAPHIRLVTFDGGHMKLVFKGHILMLVCKDPNDELTILAYGSVSSEDGDNCSWFLKQAADVFPGIEILMADQGKGLVGDQVQRVAKEYKIFIASCTNHCHKSMVESIGSKQAKGLKPFVTQLGRARTRPALVAVLTAVRLKSEEAYNYLSDRRRRLASHYTLKQDLRRGLTICNANVESTMNMVLPLRYKPIIDGIVWLSVHQATKFEERLATAQESEFFLTQAAMNRLRKQLDGCEQRYGIVKWLTRTSSVLEAVVLKRSDRTTYQCIVDRTDHENVVVSCPCLYHEDCGIMCGRVGAMILHAVKHGEYVAGSI